MKKLYSVCVILSVLLFTANIFAQPSFTPKTDFTTGNLPRSVSIGDLNGDGKQDLAVANSGTDNVSILLNTTTQGASIPTFTAKTDFTAGSSPISVSIGDFNGDGKPDLAVANYNSSTVSVFFNTTASGAATPSFTAKTDFTTGNLPISVSIGDFNGDGKPDLALANQGSNTVSVLLNTTASGASTPSFTAKTDFSTGSGPVSVSIGDLNGDGKPDLALANQGSDTVSVLLNTTASGASIPSFTVKTDFSTGSGPLSVSIGDFNGDGKPDLAVANQGSSTVSVLLNTTASGASTPSFTAKTDFTTGNFPMSVSIGDFNGDGKPDLAVTNGGPNTVSVLLNTTASGASTPSFTVKTDFSTGNNPTSVSIGDFNGDGKPDLAVTNVNSNTVSVLLNTTATNISGTTDACITWDLLSTNAVTSAVGNINGQPESIGVGSSSPFMSIFLPYSNGQRLWVGTTGWVAGPLDPMRYVEFNASPQPGNSLTVTNVSFNYGDFPLSTNFNILNFQAYYSTNNWVNSTVLNSTALVYLNTTMSLFAQPIVPSVLVPSGQTFSLRIYPYALLNGIAMTPTFAIHNNVVICGTTAPEVLDNGSICGVKYNDLNGNGVRNTGEPGLPNWTINLTGASTSSVTTDEKGKYCFTN
ncbi:MAG: FG-GAP-like repeat-containing protein, partial [Candidatus Brocadiaceae bacterium]|nr:FG-GAP-like repeat-containing protein [Candidatus Brocadiaceae bacterium]